MVWTGAIAALVLACSLLAMGGAQADTNPGLTLYEGGQVAEAAQSWRAAADGGDATAALYLGVLYDTGSGVPRDAAVALTWYERAAALGNAAAAFNVGVMFDAGVGRDADPATAAVWYRKAAAKGFGRAEYNLALLYETGSGVRVNRRRAAVLFRAAAAHGIAAANSHLTQLGVHPATLGPASDDPAMLQFTQAEAILRRRGPNEAALAMPAFQRAAQGGNAMAEYDLGYFNEHGIGGPVNTAAALDWYGRAMRHASDPGLRSMAEAAQHTLQTSAQPPTR